MSSLRFVPYSVQMRRAGYVATHSKSWSIYHPKWVMAPKAPTPDAARVDRVIDLLTRFAAKWVKQSRKARAEFRHQLCVEASKFSPDLWFDQNNKELQLELRRSLESQLARRFGFVRFCKMPEQEWNATVREWIAEHKRDGRDLLPLLRGMVARVNARRDEIQRDQARAIAEVAAVWGEITQPVLHNRQRAAPVRVARVVRGGRGFTALADSDSE
jgi:hypothetical protein